MESNDRAILKASFRKDEFSFIMEVDKVELSLSDQCLYYCMKCIEQSTDNILGYRIDFDFKASRVVGDIYVDRAMKICNVCKLFQIMNPGLFDHLQDKLQDSLRTKSSVCNALSSMQALMFQDSISWAKIIALFAFTGALVVECILRGNCEFVVNIMYSVKQFMENELVAWITKNNGWAGMLQQFESLDVNRPQDESGGLLRNIKTFFRQNILDATQRMVYSLQDAKFLQNI